jgi:branched-chain amino acid transport system substrate-binding protein
VRRFLNPRAVVLAAAATLAATTASAAPDLKIGAVLTLSQVLGVYGKGILDGLNFAVEEAGGSVAGRKIVVLQQDDKNDAQTAIQLVRRYVKDDKVAFMVGPVGSNIAPAIRDEVQRSKTFLIIPQAGNDELTRELCSPYIVRSSFSIWQMNYPMGLYAASKIGKDAVVVGANYVGGKQTAAGFSEGFKKEGGTILQEFWPAVGTADFATQFTQIRSLGDKVKVVWYFVPGSTSVNFLNQYAQSALKAKVAGPVTNADEFFFDAMKDSAVGFLGAGPYVQSIDTPRNKAFVAAFKKRYGRAPVSIDVQGYDAGRLIIETARRLKGDLSDKHATREVMVAADIDSPRGYFKIDDKTGNLIQNIYITKVVKHPDGSYGHEVLATYQKVRDTDTSCKLNWN